MNRKTLVLAIAAGTCLTAAQATLAQQLINISGATLLENYVAAPASTNDYIDVDNNGISGSDASPTLQQLAPTANNGVWTVQYRVVGSVNGFKELTQFGAPQFITSDDTDTNGILGARPTAIPAIIGVASTAYNNRTRYILTGASTGAYNAAHAGGAPNRALTSGSNRSIVGATAPNAGGITIDIAPLDVSTKWATQKPGAIATFSKTPLQTGYGLNPRLSTGKNGEVGTSAGNPHLSGGLSSFLAPLNGRNLFDPANPTAVDANTIFDTELNFAPIAPVVSLGTGITQVKMTELQHMFGTGRTVSGENLVVCTRDVGSGTRNAFMNCIGMDPSWGVGDNVGGESTLAREHNPGAFFYPTNKGSNGNMELTLRNSRLGIGYVGTERGVSGGGSGTWLTNKALEIANVQNDIYGGTNYVRPTTSNLVHNNNNGWLIGGQAVLATIGDPTATTGVTVMANPSAASYVNNIRQSINAFIAVPTDVLNVGMPGELAAFQFLLLNALDNLHDLTTPTTLVANPSFNVNVQNFILGNNVHNNAAFTAFDTTSTGRNPTRNALTSGAYSDGVALGANFVSQGGASLANGATTLLRNKIAFDFNGDGLRNVNDAADMVAAFRHRNGGPAWVAPVGTGSIAGAPGTDACIEILGDGNGDGSFNAEDVRYFADGLAMNPSTGKLDRKAGFTAVDMAFGGNFFGTTLASGKVYVNGDSRADVANAAGTVSRGWAPTGKDGVVDSFDVKYVLAQFNQAGVVGSADWSDLNEAVLFDLSADMTGDLKVDMADVREVYSILGSCTGDLNVDGKVTAAERATVQSNVGAASPTLEMGDVNGDGVINAADVAMVCPADFNCSGNVSVQDIFDFLASWFAGSSKSDFNDSGAVSVQDIFDYLAAWFAGC